MIFEQINKVVSFLASLLTIIGIIVGYWVYYQSTKFKVEVGHLAPEDLSFIAGNQSKVPAFLDLVFVTAPRKSDSKIKGKIYIEYQTSQDISEGISRGEHKKLSLKLDYAHFRKSAKDSRIKVSELFETIDSYKYSDTCEAHFIFKNLKQETSNIRKDFECDLIKKSFSKDVLIWKERLKTLNLK